MTRSASEAAHRPLGLRMRPDLRIQMLGESGLAGATVKDPVALRYLQLDEEELAILQSLDGALSLEEIRPEFERRFAPKRLSVTRLQAFVSHLHREQLLLADAPGQGPTLAERGSQRRVRATREKWLNPLVIRFRGFDPEPLWKWLDPVAKHLVSPAAILVGAVLIGAAAILLIGQMREIQSRLPEWSAVFAGNNLWLLAIAIGFAKILHELGHALVCRRLGGECHEIGFMFLVFTPCLYCTVSDSWMFASKWRRAAVAAAGIYVELVLAAIGFFLWWWTQPGSFNALCLNLAIACSVSSVLLNGNPLLKYDGYYVLADLVETPNLWQRSRNLILGGLRRWCTGVEMEEDRRESSETAPWIATYGVLSITYQWLIVATIFFFLYTTLKRHQLESLGFLLISVLLSATLARPVISLVRFAGNPSLRRRVRRGRVSIALPLILLIAAALFLAPLPCTVRAPVSIEPDHGTTIRIHVPGRIVEGVSEGQRVQRGEIIAKLRNEDLERGRAELEGECVQLESKIRQLESQRLDNPTAAGELPAVRQLLSGKRAELKRLQEDEARLDVLATADGIVFHPVEKPQESAPPGELPALVGYPLEPSNRGAFLDVDTEVCRIGDPRQLVAVAYVTQSGVDLVEVGQSVRLHFAAYPGVVEKGVVTELAEEQFNLRSTEDRSTSSNARSDESGERLEDTVYRVSIRLESASHALPVDSAGVARIRVAPRSLSRRLLRLLHETFRFRL